MIKDSEYPSEKELEQLDLPILEEYLTALESIDQGIEEMIKEKKGETKNENK